MITALDLRRKRSRVRISAVPLSCNNLGQVVHTRVPLSPSSIIWCRSSGGDALRLGRYCDRSFAVSGPVAWNSLPVALRSSDVTEETFRRHLKTFLFNCLDN